MTSEHQVRSLLSSYKYQDAARRDVMQAIKNYKDLVPQREMHVFNDGSSKELLCLRGTIPVNYKNNTYNIPVGIYLLDAHPQNAPMAYVKPTQNMQIKPSRHVDSSGKVYLPYLHEWKAPGSDLSMLIQVMCSVFGEESPVFSVSGPPARPPYPSGTPPQHALPPTSTYPPASTGYMPMAGGYPPSSGASGGPPYPPQGLPYPTGSSGGGFPMPLGGAGTGYPQSSVAGSSNVHTPVTATSTYTNQSALQDDQLMKASLRSAVEDKMRRRLKDIFAQAQMEMDGLKKTQEELSAGSQKLDEILSRLDREQAEVDTNLKILREKDEELKKVLEEIGEKNEGEGGGFDIDEAIVTTAPLYRQLLDCFAEENALEDAIYYLAEAQKKQVIDLDTYLKHVRDLSRKQFYLRATMIKCRAKAGLPAV